MKNLYPVAVLALLSACGNHNHSSEPNLVTPTDVSSVTSGLILTVRNSLPEEQIDTRRVRPSLNAYFCSPMPLSDERPLRTEERCIRLAGVIPAGGEQTFIVSQQELDRIYQQGHGQGAFEFADNQQLTSVPWNCYTPNDRVTLGTHSASRQTWNVVVNQRFALSYGCLIDRVN